MLTKRILVRAAGIGLLLVASFLLSARIATGLAVRSAKDGAPPWFPIVTKTAGDGVTMLNLGKIEKGSGAGTDGQWQFTQDEVAPSNVKLADESRSRGARWSFEIVDRQADRQYIHATMNGDDDIIESWYWASAHDVEPVKYRWLNLGVLLRILPLTAVFVGVGLAAYGWARRARSSWRRAN